MSSLHWLRLIAVGLLVRLHRLRLVYKLLLLAAIGLWVVLPLWQALAATVYAAKRSCYTPLQSPSAAGQSGSAAVWRLPDVLTASRQPRPDRTLFFVDAECRRHSGGPLQLSARQACAIESAARAHPQWDVFVLFAAPVTLGDEPEDRADPTDPDQRVAATPLAAVRQLPNVHWRTVNVWNFARNTSLADWLEADEAALFGRPDAAEHLAQLVRLVTLWRYGGVLVDWDVLVRRSLEPLGAGSWAALEAATAAAAGQVRADVMRVSSEAKGLAEFLLHEFRHRFDGGGVWSAGGLDAVNAVVRAVCGTKDGLQLEAGECGGGQFRVLPAAYFYAVPAADWTALLNARQAYYVSELVREAYAVKLWASWSGREVVRRIRRAQEPVPLLWLAEQHCGAVWAASGGYF